MGLPAPQAAAQLKICYVRHCIAGGVVLEKQVWAAIKSGLRYMVCIQGYLQDCNSAPVRPMDQHSSLPQLGKIAAMIYMRPSLYSSQQPNTW